MSHETLKYGWFGWNNAPAWITSNDGGPPRECRIRALNGNTVQLEVERAYEISGEFQLRLMAHSRSVFECRIVQRRGTLIEGEFRRNSPDRVGGAQTRFDGPTDAAARQDLAALRGLAKRRRTSSRVVSSALLVTAIASMLMLLATKFDWLKLQPAAYELASSMSSSFRKGPVAPHDAPTAH